MSPLIVHVPHWLQGLRPFRHKRSETWTSLNGCSSFEAAIRFHLWAASLREFPTPKQIVDRFGCSRAQAYRYREALGRAYGLEVPRLRAGSEGLVPITHATGEPNIRGTAVRKILTALRPTE